MNVSGSLLFLRLLMALGSSWWVFLDILGDIGGFWWFWGILGNYWFRGFLVVLDYFW